MTFKINKVATCGCEIHNENNEIIGWSIDEKWATLIAFALENYINEEEND